MFGFGRQCSLPIDSKHRFTLFPKAETPKTSPSEYDLYATKITTFRRPNTLNAIVDIDFGHAYFKAFFSPLSLSLSLSLYLSLALSLSVSLSLSLSLALPSSLSFSRTRVFAFGCTRVAYYIGLYSCCSLHSQPHHPDPFRFDGKQCGDSLNEHNKII